MKFPKAILIGVLCLVQLLCINASQLTIVDLPSEALVRIFQGIGFKQALKQALITIAKARRVSKAFNEVLTDRIVVKNILAHCTLCEDRSHSMNLEGFYPPEKFGNFEKGLNCDGLMRSGEIVSAHLPHLNGVRNDNIFRKELSTCLSGPITEEMKQVILLYLTDFSTQKTVFDQELEFVRNLLRYTSRKNWLFHFLILDMENCYALQSIFGNAMTYCYNPLARQGVALEKLVLRTKIFGLLVSLYKDLCSGGFLPLNLAPGLRIQMEEFIDHSSELFACDSSLQTKFKNWCHEIVTVGYEHSDLTRFNTFAQELENPPAKKLRKFDEAFQVYTFS